MTTIAGPVIRDKGVNSKHGEPPVGCFTKLLSGERPPWSAPLVNGSHLKSQRYSLSHSTTWGKFQLCCWSQLSTLAHGCSASREQPSITRAPDVGLDQVQDGGLVGGKSENEERDKEAARKNSPQQSIMDGWVLTDHLSGMRWDGDRGASDAYFTLPGVVVV